MAESRIARWLTISGGNLVLPFYEIEYETRKGPRLFEKYVIQFQNPAQSSCQPDQNSLPCVVMHGSPRQRGTPAGKLRRVLDGY